MKKLIIILMVGLATLASTAQSLTLEECYTRAKTASSINMQLTTNRETSKYDLRAASAAYTPQGEINAQATYQSDVVRLPFEVPIPSFDFKMAKDQYRASIDLRQLIYDGGYVANQRRMIENNARGQNERIAIAELELKNRVNGIFLGILLADQHAQLSTLYINDIQTNIKTIEGMIGLGVASTVDLNVLKAEKMKAEQKLIEMHSNRENLIEILSILIDMPVAPATQFIEPTVEIELYTKAKSDRPEYRLLETERKDILIQQKIVSSRNLPKAYAFASAGNGRPGLNMLSSNFEWFAMAGVKLTVPLTEWSSTTNIKQSLRWKELLSKEYERDFARNNQIQIQTEINRIEKLHKLIESDKQIVELRDKISEAEREKLIRGTTTSSQYVIEINAQNQAQQNIKLHQIELIQAMLNYQTALGK